MTPIPQINAENERTKYVTQLISLIVGAPASNVIAMFGMEFYTALGPGNPGYSIGIYGTYLSQAGFSPEVIEQKCTVFGLYADADASPEVFFPPLYTPLHPRPTLSTECDAPHCAPPFLPLDPSPLSFR